MLFPISMGAPRVEAWGLCFVSSGDQFRSTWERVCTNLVNTGRLPGSGCLREVGRGGEGRGGEGRGTKGREGKEKVRNREKSRARINESKELHRVLALSRASSSYSIAYV